MFCGVSGVVVAVGVAGVGVSVLESSGTIHADAAITTTNTAINSMLLIIQLPLAVLLSWMS